MMVLLAAIGAALIIALAVIGGLALWGLFLDETDDDWPKYRRR